MPSATETTVSVTASARKPRAGGLAVWNRRLHIYAGLYFLFFVWLFALTGLLLNHPQWAFAEFWPNRHITSSAHAITVPDSANDLARARNLAEQLGVTGEIELNAAANNAQHFSFRVSRPGHLAEVKADLGRSEATLVRTDLNGWGVLHILHTFTGVKSDGAAPRRQWLLTSVWVLAMDALAAGLIVMVVTSLLLWYQRKDARLWGAVVLILGWLSCGLFCAGLRWFYAGG